MSVPLSGLLERLNLSRDEGEKWIMNLIRETRMGADAKIDLEKVHSSSPFSFHRVNMALTPQNVIEIYRLPQPVYQSVIEKTHGLALRTGNRGCHWSCWRTHSGGATAARVVASAGSAGIAG